MDVITARPSGLESCWAAPSFYALRYPPMTAMGFLMLHLLFGPIVGALYGAWAGSAASPDRLEQPQGLSAVSAASHAEPVALLPAQSKRAALSSSVCVSATPNPVLGDTGAER